jgi:GNAT superfamily N-acetyltransferase
LKEVEELVELWNRFMKEHREMGREWKEDRIPEMRNEAPDLARVYFARNIRSKNGLLLVLEDQGRIRGYMLSMIQKNIPVFKNDLVGEVGTLYLERPYRGKGYSSRLFSRTMEWFSSKGIDEVLIRVMCCNPHAHKIYEHWGFKDIHVEMRLDL